jgi:hypothetical protein
MARALRVSREALRSGCTSAEARARGLDAGVAHLRRRKRERGNNDG